MRTLIDDYLEEQQRLQTPVARFSKRHDTGFSEPALAPVYRDLIPLSAPKPGEQYAFEVDLDSCSGCKACVAGCHSLNGLEEEETWRDVGLVIGGNAAHPFQQTITTACHHCEDPGCLNGCPVLAYEKDPVTGIVRHLDDQCIGCSYCILKCPYDVPKFSKRLGIVRKCDMCHSRLAEGEAPACVQACPTHAIRIVKVVTTLSDGGVLRPDSMDELRSTEIENRESKIKNSPTFLPVFPDPSYTRPTTRYISKRPLPKNLHAADAQTLRVQPAHWPLVLMLVLTQASVGALGAFVARDAAGKNAPALLWISIATCVAGLAASVGHLGQPLRAWRVFLGLRRSWLSREAVIFGGYFPLLASLLVLDRPALSAAALATGVLGVFCSVMIYVDTHRVFWSLPRTLARFGGTTAALGLAIGACFDLRLAPFAAIATILKLGPELALLRFHIRRVPSEPDAKSSRMLIGPLANVTLVRFISAVAGAGLLFAAWSPACAWAGLAALLVSEIAERYLFFRAIDAPKMPGRPAAP